MIDRLHNGHYIIGSVIFFLLSDALQVFFPELIDLKASYFFKGVVLFYSLVLASNILAFKEMLLLIVFVLLFIGSQSFLFFSEKINRSGIIDNLRFFTWYLFGLFLMLVYNKLSSIILEPKIICLLNKIALAIISVVCISILVGFLFDLQIFRSYSGPRWGYKGILTKTVTASYFFLLALNYLYFSYVISKKKYSFFFGVLFCSMLCGTKTIYIFILLLFIFHTVSNRLFKLKSFRYSFIASVILIIVFRNQILNKTEFFWGLFYKLYRENGLMYSFTSYRSQLLVNGIKDYREQWDWINYLIGGRIIEIKYFEMAFFDLFYFFGTFGCLLFIFILYRSVVIPFLKETQLCGFFILFSIFLASFFTGQFFINSTVIVLFFYFFITIQTNAKFNEQNKHPQYTHS